MRSRACLNLIENHLPRRREGHPQRAQHIGRHRALRDGYGADPQEPIQESGDERGDYTSVPQGPEDEEEPEDWEPRWTDAEWKEWRKQQKKEWYDDDSSSGEDLPWDKRQVEEIQVLPDDRSWMVVAQEGKPECIESPICSSFCEQLPQVPGHRVGS